MNRNKKKQGLPLKIVSSNNSPIISMFLPFEPKMFRKADLDFKLMKLKQQAELQLSRDFFVSGKEELLDRLNTVIGNINFSTHKKSVAIYVTAKAEKVFYLDIPLSEKVMIGISYNIRSLVDSKNDVQPFLALAIDHNSSRICSGSNGILSTIISNAVIPNEKIDKNKPPTVFLTQVDRRLAIILQSFSCPLFVIGTAEILNQYKAITKNISRISEFIICDPDDLSEAKTGVIMRPYITNWKKVKDKYLLQKLYEASFNRKLAVGVSDVLHVAEQKRGELLIVERNYTYPVVHAYDKKMDLIKNIPTGTMFTDLVDEIIEAVLENGGDVEFVDEGVLNKFMHIALIHR